jgi:uncharacterized protein YdaU (DUF1376 family)
MSNDESSTPPMPFDGTKFFEAVQMFDDETALKYIRALWFYWSHTHCTGIPNDEQGLRELLKCDLGKWARVKGLIFDNDKFFCLDCGKWHQKRCLKTYLKTMETIQKKQAQTEAARNAILVKKTVTSNVTDESWLESLATNPAFAGIDIKRELGKLTAWCSVNRKDVSRRRFINWLNRADKPLNVATRLSSTPSRAVVIEYAKQKGDADGFVLGWYDRWSAREFQRNGTVIDWKEQFSKDFSQQRTNGLKA